MTASSPLTFKIADRPAEIDQIHRLNYETFVEEIPQHPANPDRLLIDQFHPENTYLIALHGEMLVGMIAARGIRPFSLDYKLENLDQYLPAHTSICEFRLLAVRPEWRGGQVLLGLMDLLNRYCLEHGHDLGIISGTTRQQKLYRHLGFDPFGPLVGKGDVRFQPMFLTVGAADAQSRPLLDVQAHRRQAPSPANFLPGPVAVASAVKAAFALDPISHRSEEFRDLLHRVKERLLSLTNAKHVEVMNGSGTTANDAIAAQLSLINGYGLIVTNGEFGERLIDHASRFNLKFDTGRHRWGEPLRYDAIDRTAKRDRHQWIWMVHCETSTGMLNDLDRMKEIARGSGARLVVDCIGSLGTVPLDLAGVFLAGATSGKGLASYAGLGLVFLDHPPRTGDRIPRSLDLGYYAQQQGIPFTMFSSHVAALDRALDRIEEPAHYSELAVRSERVRSAIGALGFTIVAAPEYASPAVFTIALPVHQDAGALGEALAANGIFVNYESAYLRDRNWLQVCLMGNVPDADIERLVQELSRRDGPRVRPC
jgi:aspartate aminotransferase-like enzyme